MPLEDIKILKRYPNEVFCETGTYKGDGVQMALDCGFTKVHSMEIFEPLYLQSSKRFVNDFRVKIWRGDTSNNLIDMICNINQPITFWLDSHASGCDSSYNANCPNPLLKELEVISKHPIKTHTILMDDVRFFNEWGMPIELLMKIILDINPLYNFCFEDGFQKEDIFVAYIP